VAYFLGDPQAPGYQQGDGWLITMREYALRDNKPWDYYIRASGQNWPAERLGDGGDPNWTGYGDVNGVRGFAADPSGSNYFSIAHRQTQGYNPSGNTSTPGTTPGAQPTTPGAPSAPQYVPPGTPPGPPTTNPPGGSGAPPFVDDAGLKNEVKPGANEGNNALHTWLNPSVSPQIQELFNQLLGGVNNLINSRSGPNAPQLPGTVPGLNADQNAGQDYYRWMANNFGQLFNPAMQQQQQFFSNAQNPLANPAVTDMMEENAARVNQAASDPGGIWSQIRANALDAGQFGSSRQGIAEGIAAGRVADEISRGNTSILNNAWNTAQNAAVNALGQTGDLANTWTMPGNLLSATGQQSYDQSERELQDQLRRWMFQYQQPENNLALLSQVLGLGMPLGVGSHTAVDYPDFYLENQGAGSGSGNTNLGALLALLGGISALR
jgi:hypothetical protein